MSYSSHYGGIFADKSALGVDVTQQQKPVPWYGTEAGPTEPVPWWHDDPGVDPYAPTFSPKSKPFYMMTPRVQATMDPKAMSAGTAGSTGMLWMLLIIGIAGSIAWGVFGDKYGGRTQRSYRPNPRK